MGTRRFDERGFDLGDVDDSQLPPGVSPTNDKQAFSESEFVAPDTATPVNLTAEQKSAAAAPQSPFETSREMSAATAANPTKASLPPSVVSMRRLIMLVTAAGLLTALLAVAMSNRSDGAALCSEQPHWNQYNCQPG